MARSPVTRMVEEFNSLTEVEQKVFLDLVDPQPEPEVPKQTRKRRTKSVRAQSLSSVISKTPKVDADARCVAQVPTLDVPCGEPEDALIHDPKGGYASYHPFLPAAPIVAKRSSRKGAAANSTANTEGETGTALSVGASGD